MEIKAFITILLIAVISTAVLFLGMYPAMKSTQKFFEKRKELEEEIRTIDDKDSQIKKTIGVG